MAIRNRRLSRWSLGCLRRLFLGPEKLERVAYQCIKVHIVGFAQSNARVSTLMRNLGSSPLFGQPVLIEVRAVTQNKRPVSQFIVDVGIARVAPDQAKAGKAAGDRKS